ncbi:M48 family metallopeptidase [Vibrio ostreicida]|uniref:M48 family metallopeptidase n=1 Tax=Vibrio ostreicida TaxID=526588 RepID=A0ABT8BQ48_9VIBR|nr:M48 family metallopeptidase [Vibrio ostreicida]MDN3608257.1 M48 family metallopeptidase [Vibrio ostreicida]NPD09759.1 M48 family metallopeptidase [Vibrio ostreicida]
MRMDGIAFPPRSSVKHDAVLDVSQTNRLSLCVDGQIMDYDLQQTNISAPVGNLPIRFTFSNGWVFVVDKDTHVDQFLEKIRKASVLDKVESNSLAWLLSAVACVALIIGTYLYVIPWMSDRLAEAIPHRVSVILGDKVLEHLDNSWEPSKISHERQDLIRQRIKGHVESLGEFPYPITVVFRSSKMGANAFALPGGKIVLLDKLVALAGNEQQLDSVILHELGHIHHNHVMKNLVYSSLLSVGVAVLTGESSGIVDTLASVGVFLSSNSHSRDAETQADHYAKKAMVLIYGHSEPMVEMFEKMHMDAINMPEWLSTHPDLDQRIRTIREP